MSLNLALLLRGGTREPPPPGGRGVATGPRRGGFRGLPGIWFAKGSVLPCIRPTLPCRGGPAPCGRWSAGTDLSASRWLGVHTPALPTRCTHPVYPPWYPPGPSHTELMHHTTVAGTPRTCTYDRFGDSVGEPRGVRTQPCFRVPDWFILRYEVYTAV